MAKEILVRDQLSDEMIQAGEKLLNLLEVSDEPVLGAFWLFLPDEHLWRLYIASDLVRTAGARQAYQQVHEALKRFHQDEWVLSLHDITVIDGSDKVFQAFSHAINDDVQLNKQRFFRERVQQQFIEDAWVYKAA